MEALAVSMSPSLTENEQAELVEIFSNDFSIMPQGKNLSSEWAELILVAKDTGTVAGAVNALVLLGKSINTWRKKMRDKGRKPSVHIVGGGGSLLDLSTATDEEVLNWIRALESAQDTKPEPTSPAADG